MEKYNWDITEEQLNDWIEECKEIIEGWELNQGAWVLQDEEPVTLVEVQPPDTTPIELIEVYAENLEEPFSKNIEKHRNNSQ